MLTVQNNKWRNKEQLWAKIRKEVWAKIRKEVWTAKMSFDTNSLNI